MADTVIKTTFQFRRGQAATWASKDPVLEYGEPGFESDTGRLKIGTSDKKHWSQLPYFGGGGVCQGYYYNGAFYSDVSHTHEMPASVEYIYIDISNSNIYFYNGSAYVQIINGGGTIVPATDTTPGVMKLYNAAGANTDGTITQKFITEELNKKVEASVDSAHETLILD